MVVIEPFDHPISWFGVFLKQTPRYNIPTGIVRYKRVYADDLWQSVLDETILELFQPAFDPIASRFVFKYHQVGNREQATSYKALSKDEVLCVVSTELPVHDEKWAFNGLSPQDPWNRSRMVSQEHFLQVKLPYLITGWKHVSTYQETLVRLEREEVVIRLTSGVFE